MVRVLNVAEKNDAAKSISDVMSNGRYRKVKISCMYKDLSSSKSSLKQKEYQGD